MIDFLKNIFIFFFFLILLPLFYLRILAARVVKKEKKLRILVLNNAKIGDLICSTPLFRAIKEKYPESYLGVFATHKTAGILMNNKNIDKLFVYYGKEGKTWQLIKEIRKYNFNVAITMVPGTLTLLIPFFCFVPLRIAAVIKKTTWLYYFLYLFYNYRVIYLKNTLSIKNHLKLLEPLGVNNRNLKKEIFIDDDSLAKAERFLAANNIRKEDIVVGICLTAGNKIKEWGAENYSQLAGLLINNFNYKIIMVGGPSDGEILKKTQKLTNNKTLITYNDFTLQELSALVNRFDYFIGSDSGPLYIANALGVPVVDILGPCSLYDQPPVYEKCEAVYAENLECWPCSYYADPAVECRGKSLQCIKTISPEIVLEAFVKLLQNYGKR